MDSKPWLSPDGKWTWDGTSWQPSGSAFGNARPLATSIPKTVWVIRAALAGEALAIGCTGSMLALIAVIVLVADVAAGQISVRFAFGLLVVIVALLFAAVGSLILLIFKLGPVLNAWSLAAFVTQLALVPGGYFLVNLADYLMANAGAPSNPGTDGPFADGLTGGIGLMGFAFVIGGSVALFVLLWEAARVLSVRALSQS